MKSTFLILFFSLSVLGFNCASHPYKTTNKVYKKKAKELSKTLSEYPLVDSLPQFQEFVGTVNFGLRKPNYVIIHHTAQKSCDQTLKTFTLERTQVSAHYVICRDGSVYHMLNDYLRAWHAGASKWGNAGDINSLSIGIELDNDGSEIFPASQITSLLQVLKNLKKTYGIPDANFIGHADIAPGRKVDPNRNFPWQQLAQQGYGVWYDTTSVSVPENFDPMMALRIIGYNIQKPNAAIGSYKIHFVPSDSTLTITEADKKILFSLQQQLK